MILGKRNTTVDVIKGICILFVIITHFEWQNSERMALGFPFWIDMAVPVFMIISGYVSSLSAEKRNIKGVSDLYLPSVIVPKLIRYTIPFLIIYLINSVIFFSDGSWGISQIVFGIFSGGTGPGAYYYPVLIQFVFLFPVVYGIIKKYDFNGLILCVFANLFYELIKCLYGMSDSEYRLLVFRYITVIAAGCYIAVGKCRFKPIIAWFSMILGAFWICIVKYGGYTPKLINIVWSGTSMLASLWIIPVVWVLIKRTNITFLKPIEYIGKASYNIFFIQLLYYLHIDDMVYNHFGTGVSALMLSVAICVIFGLLFYIVESRITSLLIKILDKNRISKIIAGILNVFDKLLVKQ